MMVRFIVIVTILLCSYSCSTYCSNGKVEKRLNKYISVLEEDFQPDLIINGDFFIAIFFLTELTGIESSADYGEITKYKSFSDYHNDMKKWKKWIEKNECELTVEKIDSTEVYVMEKTTWITPK